MNYEVVTIETLAGQTCAVLHEPGKMDYGVPITDEQVKWVNALKYLVNPRQGETPAQWPPMSAERLAELIGKFEVATTDGDLSAITSDDIGDVYSCLLLEVSSRRFAASEKAAQSQGAL